MDWQQLFSIAGNIALVGWLILILGPRRWPALNAVPHTVIPGILSLGYAGLVLVYFARAPGSFGSLDDRGRLFGSKPALLAGWVRYLAFDLFAGARIARGCDRRRIARLVQAPILAATFMFGPVGLLLYLLVSGGWSAAYRRLAVEA